MLITVEGLTVIGGGLTSRQGRDDNNCMPGRKPLSGSNNGNFLRRQIKQEVIKASR